MDARRVQGAVDRGPRLAGAEHGIRGEERTHVGDAAYPCAISIGRTPTFGGKSQQIEAHLLDFSGDVYDQPMRLEFHRFLRDQNKFDSVEALVEQLWCDVEAVRQEANGPELPGEQAGGFLKGDPETPRQTGRRQD